MAPHAPTRTMRPLLGWLASALLLTSLPAVAQLPSLPSAGAVTQGRNFPQNTKRGTLSPAVFPEVQIDGNLRRLSPGARIFSQTNMLVLPNALEEGSKVIVNYQEDGMGLVSKIWILTADESKRSLPRPVR